MKRINPAGAMAVLASVAALLVFVSLFVGQAGLGIRDVLNALVGEGEGLDSTIVLDVRLPRAILAFIVGAALAGSGVAFQGIFRNPLADPFIVGVSGGAALGAVIAIVSGIELNVFGLGITTLAAFAGALSVTGLVYRIAAVRGRVPVTSLLLAGFAVGAFAGAVVSILMLLHTQNWGEILLWLLGSLQHADVWLRVKLSLPFVVLALAAIGFYARELNVMLLGDESAQHLGVEVERARKVLLVAGTIAAATAVAMCGIIGFVGLIIPHVVRLLVGPDHRSLLPVTILAGGAFLVAADILARVALPPAGLPVGTVTALAGAPFFLLLLRRHGRRI